MKCKVALGHPVTHTGEKGGGPSPDPRGLGAWAQRGAAGITVRGEAGEGRLQETLRTCPGGFQTPPHAAAVETRDIGPFMDTCVVFP